MTANAGYVVATRNRASGHLAIDWDGEIHDRLEDAVEQRAAAIAAGADAEILRLTLMEDDSEDRPRDAPYRCEHPGCDGSSEAGRAHTAACNRSAWEASQTHG